MNLSPKEQGQEIPLNGHLPETLEEAKEYIDSKFPFISDSTMCYEEFLVGEETIRAIHITYAFGAKIEGQDSVKNLIQLWLFAMMDAMTNSGRSRLYWRMKPEMTVTRRDFPDGPAWAVEIVSRSAMV